MPGITAAYYARPMSLYGSDQERDDEAMIRRMGHVPINFKTPEIDEHVRRLKAEGKSPMEPFLMLVDGADVLYYRTFPDGTLGAGVAAEVDRAVERGIPVVEIPYLNQRRRLDVEETRARLRFFNPRGRE